LSFLDLVRIGVKNIIGSRLELVKGSIFLFYSLCGCPFHITRPAHRYDPSQFIQSCGYWSSPAHRLARARVPSCVVVRVESPDTRRQVLSMSWKSISWASPSRVLPRSKYDFATPSLFFFGCLLEKWSVKKSRRNARETRDTAEERSRVKATRTLTQQAARHRTTHRASNNEAQAKKHGRRQRIMSVRETEQD
jgi:hypothetical protein